MDSQRLKGSRGEYDCGVLSSEMGSGLMDLAHHAEAVIVTYPFSYVISPSSSPNNTKI